MNPPQERSQLSVLVIDDEPQIRRLLTLAFEANGYRAFTAGDGNGGIAAAAQRRHNAIILDLGLPDINGVEVLKNLRKRSQIPVIVLTVQDGETEKVESLDCGADDYVTKPFNMPELLARVRATVRRANRGEEEDSVCRFGDVEIKLADRQVRRKGEVVKLTDTEYILFRFFAQHAGKVLTHRQIMRGVWGAAHEFQTSILRVCVARLREKLETNPAEPALIATEPGIGYRLVETFEHTETGQIRPNIDWCDISNLVRVTLEGLKDQIYGRRIRVLLPKNLPLVRADFMLIKQALAHLVLETVTYTNPETLIEISAQMEKDFLALTVLEEGIALHKGPVEGIFNPFQRGGVTTTEASEYRLARTRNFVEAQGGRLEASNHGPGGAAFTIYLSAREDVSLPQEIL